jgi:hypothetical protein
MNTAPDSVSPYKVGGSLEFNHPTYVVRQADQDLYDGLKRGEFCYVLNSRQMGKSSLRVRTMCKLQEEGIACADIDLTGIGSQQVTAEQWYGGIIQELVSCFQLKVNRRSWLREREDLSPVQRFSEFIEEVLLGEISQNIVIFVDEIDKVLSLNFSFDDFFSLIRFCYNKRADKPEYKRLTFALLGVATPSDLIQDKERTPFNIGKAIQLNGFNLLEALPLAKGLERKVSNAQAVLEQVLYWTDGQPFLTQKLCDLILKLAEPIPSNNEKKEVGNLVYLKVIKDWESQDNPEHLKTIHDRILTDKNGNNKLLKLYQNILDSENKKIGKILSNDSPEQRKLQLSGLVLKEQGELRIFNRIYKRVFGKRWVDKALKSNQAYAPYDQKMRAWLNFDCKDESLLLRGEGLKNALAWAEDKNLSNQDYKFLMASQKLENRCIEVALEKERQDNKIIGFDKQEIQNALAAEKQVKQELDLELVSLNTALEKLRRALEEVEHRYTNLQLELEVNTESNKNLVKIKKKANRTLRSIAFLTTISLFLLTVVGVISIQLLRQEGATLWIGILILGVGLIAWSCQIAWEAINDGREETKRK